MLLVESAYSSDEYIEDDAFIDRDRAWGTFVTGLRSTIGHPVVLLLDMLDKNDIDIARGIQTASVRSKTQKRSKNA
jgi:hypothetical protein